jgi:DNA mismatch repair ATPase MutS
MKNPNNLTLPAEFEVILRKGANVYMTTTKLLALNDTTRLVGLDVIRMSNKILCEMLAGIAKEIDAIHYLIGIIVDLDLVQSLTEISMQENFCCPTFGRVMRIENAYHPMLDTSRNKETVIMNNVVS